MFRRSALAFFGLAPLALGIWFALLGEPAGAQQKPKELQWTHAFDLAVRRYGEEKFTDKTQKFGVEAFKDNNNGLGLYISQTGSIAVAQGFDTLTGPIAKSEGPKWLTGLDVQARKAGEKAFTKETRYHSMEVFLDANTNNWLYITEKANLAATAARNKAASANAAPKWLHSFDVKFRKGGIKEWGPAKYGIEVYRDQNTGNLLFITEAGQITAAPEITPVKVEGKAPDPPWLHALDLRCRKHDEKSFSKDTRNFGVEVFHDVTTGYLVFVCETGSIAVAPAPKDVKAPTAKVKDPHFSHGLNVKCRKVGEKDFSPKTQVFGVEVFRDENVGVILYICETGAIAAAPAR
jgi:hypothetical protein